MPSMPIELQAARLRLARERTYLTAALWMLIPVEKKGMGTMGVDKYARLYYDPDVPKMWNADELTGVLYHEIGHFLREHNQRRDNMAAHPVLWNYAADAEINDDLLAEHGVVLPMREPDKAKNEPGFQPITPKLLGMEDGLLAEEYYNKIMANAKHIKVVQCKTCSGTGRVQKPQQQGQQGQGQQQQGQQGGGNQQGDQSGQKGQQGQGSGHQPGGTMPCPDCGGSGVTGEHGEHVIPVPGAGNCGSVADGVPRSWEDGAPERGQPGVSESEAELIRRQVAKDVEQHSKTRGTVPGWLERWAKEKLQPRVNWKKQLQAAIRASVNDIAGRTDYSYRRPSRRASVLPNVVLPSMRQPVPNIMVQIDTSGSMSDKMIAQAIAETSGVLKALGLRDGVLVISVDAAVGAARKVFRADQVVPVGGGGTDMGVGIQYVQALRHPPDLLIILTDCYTPWPQNPPRFRVVIGRLSDGEVPSWAKVIDIRDEKD